MKRNTKKHTKTMKINKTQYKFRKSRVKCDETPIDLNLWVLLASHVWKDLFKKKYIKMEKNTRNKNLLEEENSEKEERRKRNNSG